uniref:Putative nuclease HARBI1 n=1 Tax=Anthurium amnicola TaxID=1678845 RepID=A0A1D1Y3L9_9ARAE
MGPIRGLKRKRRQEKKAARDAAALAALSGSQQQEPSDWWDDFSKRITGPLSTSKGLDNFESVFKISRKTFNYICSLVKEDLMARPSNFTCSNGRALSVNDQVAVALRRLSSGESLLNVGQSFGMNQSTVSQVTWRFVEAMEERGIHHLRWPTTKEMETIKSKFEKIRGLPNCCGAIDTTHIMMCLPSVDPSNTVWIDYEKHHSMVLQAIVDPEMRFRDIVAGWPGSMNGFLILQNSGFFKSCQKDTKLNGNKMELSEGSEVREYIIGDASFPLLPWLLTPYQGKDLQDSKAEFNKRHLATRLVAQRALARLKEMWKIVQGEMWRPDKHRLPRIILVCCILHNILIDLEDEARDQLPLSHQHDLGYRQQFCSFSDKNAQTLREKLSHYLFGGLPP